MDLERATKRPSVGVRVAGFIESRALVFSRFGLLVVAFAVLGLALATSGGQVFATPIQWTGDRAPVVTGDDVIGSSFNWVAAFASLVLAGMALRWAPKIVRSMKSLG